jgi:HSP20 family molecular chaperone IbpA
MPRGSNSQASFVLAFGAIDRSLPIGRAVSDGYPPFNIERIAGFGAEATRLRITLAVAGFTVDQIDIVEQREQLVISGRQKDERERLHIYRGIAARPFQRAFRLGEAMTVATATLERGLLSIELAPAGPEKE